jgi:hypothetical protein
LFQDVLEGFAADTLPFDQSSKVAICARTFLAVSNIMVKQEKNPRLVEVLEKHADQWKAVVNMASQLLSPSAVSTSAGVLSDRKVGLWRAYVLDDHHMRRNIEDALSNFLESTVLLRVAAINSLLKVMKTLWSHDGKEIMRKLCDKVQDNQIWINRIAKSKVRPCPRPPCHTTRLT